MSDSSIADPWPKQKGPRRETPILLYQCYNDHCQIGDFSDFKIVKTSSYRGDRAANTEGL